VALDGVCFFGKMEIGLPWGLWAGLSNPTVLYKAKQNKNAAMAPQRSGTERS